MVEREGDYTPFLPPNNNNCSISFANNVYSGKSSIISLLLGLIDPVPGPTGQVLVDGTPIFDVDRTVLRFSIIASSQDAVFLPDGTSFRANLDPWNQATENECEDTLAVVGLTSIINEKGGLDGLLKASEFSIGQKKLFCLGRSVLRRRVRKRFQMAAGHSEGGLLLLDEVTSGVHVETQEAMMEIIQNEFDAYSVLMVTHDMQLAKRCNRIVVIDNGHI